MIAAGKLDRLVEIQTVTETISDSGVPVETWTKLADVWAYKRDITARERFRANQEIGEETAVFEIRHRSDVPSTARLIDGAKVYQLGPPVELDRGTLELTGTVVRA